MALETARMAIRSSHSFTLWLVSLACVVVGLINRSHFEDATFETRPEEWQHWETQIFAWYLAGLLAFWAQLFTWCFVGVSRENRPWATFIWGLFITGFIFAVLALLSITDSMVP